MKRTLGFAVFAALCISSAAVYAQEGGAAPQLIDNFEKQGNTFGGRSSTYMKQPSGIVALRTDKVFYGDSGRSLALRYKKAAEGGPYGKGGWCGYYTVIKRGPRQYFDASGYKYLTFWIKGEKGGENFKIGVADETWDQREDSMKSEDIGVYLEAQKITTEWQKAKIPLEDFWVDTSKLASIAVCFESECFPEGGGQGDIYIDDLQFE
ncbi:MAG: hypothetical protein C4541_02995 [Candidatus Auribacter fodinae]|jgi:hypothetical protein|uniref:Carbohydrate binding domain-containing protein n=1 Tax=Candidatus Auribacter fodinae TaxID=2093366 RepID=A0A3A4R4E9_9BACT|nr:MAG: hypothetical protein C4541_02995 [Candidatus Auribacter fodinae]